MKMADDSTSNDLHKVCSNTQSDITATAIQKYMETHNSKDDVDVDVDAAMKKDADGRTALHHLISNPKATDAAIMKYFDLCPEAFVVKGGPEDQNPIELLLQESCTAGSFPVLNHIVNRMSPSLFASSSSSSSSSKDESATKEWKNKLIQKKRSLIQKLILAEGKNRHGSIKSRRGRLTVVGQEQCGKTSTVSSLMGESFQSYPRSTRIFDRHEVLPGKLLEDGRESSWSSISKGGEDSAGYYLSRMLQMQLVHGQPIKDTASGGEEPASASSPTLKKQKGEDGDALQSGSQSSSANVSVPVPVPASKEEESKEDKVMMEKMDDLDLEDVNDRQIALSIYDFGGFQGFNTFQHFFMPRKSCYMVVFSLIDLFRWESEQVMEHLEFWLQAIETHAVLKSKEESSTDDSSTYPPVILVGTHLDDLLAHQTRKNEKNPDKDFLQETNDILIANFSDLKAFQTAKDSPFYNAKQDLCFWPVDNTDYIDPNIEALRGLVRKAVVDDPLQYWLDEVPLSWIKAMDEMRSMYGDDDEDNDLHVIPVAPSIDKEDDVSAVSILEKHGAFESDKDTNQDEKVQIAKNFLKFCTDLGVFVYFDNLPQLNDSCVIDLSWMRSAFIFIVRNVRLHRCEIDFDAVRLFDDEWSNWCTGGIMVKGVLDMFWDSSEYTFFKSGPYHHLIALLFRLGIFAHLTDSPIDKKKKTGGERRFLVPAIAVIALTDPEPDPDQKIEPGAPCSEIIGSIKFPNNFLPMGFFHNLVTRITGRLVEESMESDPFLQKSGFCKFQIKDGRKKISFALKVHIEPLNSSSKANRRTAKSINILSTDESYSEKILTILKDEMESVHEEMYSHIRVITSFTPDDAVFGNLSIS